MNARLALLSTVDRGVAESEVFRLALQHVVGELGALGGMIHLRGPRSALRLVSTAGLPPAMTASWETVDQGGPLPPARVLHHGRQSLWTPVHAVDITWPGTGLAALPLSTGADLPAGALTVLMGDQGEPTRRQWEFLRAVVTWAEERMAEVSSAPGHRFPSGAGAKSPTGADAESWSEAGPQPLTEAGPQPSTEAGPQPSTEAGPRDALSRALRHMTDGFLAMDDAWRITYANLEAERKIGFSAEELTGRVLWDLAYAQQIPGMESRCRAAASEGRAASFDVDIPSSGRRCHVRLVPGPDGYTIYCTDVTDMRRLEDARTSAERAASERAVRIAALTAALAKATTSQEVIDAVAGRVLRPFAATGLIVQAFVGDRLKNVGAVGYTDEFLALVDDRLRSPSSPCWEVIVSGEPLFFASPEEYLAYAPGDAHLADHAGKQSWAFLPLTAYDHTFGVCVIAFDDPRALTGEERALLNAISALLAQSLERARLYDAERTRSRELQRALLPQALPNLPSCESAARYLPSAEGMDVGGDWYDVIPLSSGQVALVVGDVMGHGLPEAATMGRLRTAVHTLADLELPPDEIMTHLNHLVAGMGEESYVTCLYALYDSTTQICSLARAGHPPPALIHPDGTVHFPEMAADPPLGAAEPPFETLELHVPDGSLLVLYTDGLVESAKREIDEGMAALARLLRTAHADGTTVDLERLCDTLTEGLLPAGHQAADDAAFLVSRLHALTDDRMASWPLLDDPRAAGQARRHVREQLTEWGLDDLVPTTELLASELVGNVVRHAKGPVRLRLLHGSELTCEVFDGSLTMPRIRRATDTDEGGRGLQLITALSQRWGTRYTPTGKCIWTEQPLTGPDARGHRSESGGPEFLFPMDFDGELDALTFGELCVEPGWREAAEPRAGEGPEGADGCEGRRRGR
ncbi:SpoIIE family protein phosphatase [Streptomyces sp. NPDC002643]